MVYVCNQRKTDRIVDSGAILKNGDKIMKNMREGSLLDRKTLYTYIAHDNGTTFVDTRTWCDAIFRSIARALTEGRDVQIPEIGRLVHFDTKGYTMRKSFGKEVQNEVMPKRKLRFKLSKNVARDIERLPLVAEEIALAEEATDDFEG